MSASLRPPEPSRLRLESIRTERPPGFPSGRFSAAVTGPAAFHLTWSDVGDALNAEHLARDLATRIAGDPLAFREAIGLALGDKVDRASVDALIDAARADRLPVPPVRFVEPGALGAGVLGAYATEGGGLILLDRSLLTEPEALAAVYAEEWAHHVDARLGGADARGDEGAIFAGALLGPGGASGLDASTLSRLRAENDHGWVVLEGRAVAAEFFGPAPDSPAGGARAAADGPGGGGGPGTTGPSDIGRSESDKDKEKQKRDREKKKEPPPVSQPPSPESPAGGARAASELQEPEETTSVFGDTGETNVGDTDGPATDGPTGPLGPVLDLPPETDPFAEIPGVGSMPGKEEFPNGVPGIASPLPADAPPRSDGEGEGDGGGGSVGAATLGGGAVAVGVQRLGASILRALGPLASLLTLEGSSTAPPPTAERADAPAPPPGTTEGDRSEASRDDLTPEELALAFGRETVGRDPSPMPGDTLPGTDVPPSLAGPVGPIGTPPLETDPLAGTGIPGFDPAPSPEDEFPNGIPGIASPLPVDEPLRSEGTEDDPLDPEPPNPGPGGGTVSVTASRQPLPSDPDALLEQGYVETSHPDAVKNGHRTFEKDGETIRFDEGEPGKPGYRGQDHYHRFNPNATSRHDAYLDKNGNPVPRNSEASHLLPGD